MSGVFLKKRVPITPVRLRSRNLCNHRDYQNLARNGAQSNDTLEYMRSIQRSKAEDRPAIVFYSLIGKGSSHAHKQQSYCYCLGFCLFFVSKLISPMTSIFVSVPVSF